MRRLATCTAAPPLKSKPLPAVRVSPHVCNGEADLLRLAEAPAAIRRAAT
jgi:hypothetical protein